MKRLSVKRNTTKLNIKSSKNNTKIIVAIPVERNQQKTRPSLFRPAGPNNNNNKAAGMWPDDTIAFGGNILSNHSSVDPKMFFAILSIILFLLLLFSFLFSSSLRWSLSCLLICPPATNWWPSPHIFNHPTMYRPPPLAHCNGFAPATKTMTWADSRWVASERKKRKKKRRAFQKS